MVPRARLQFFSHTARTIGQKEQTAKSGRPPRAPADPNPQVAYPRAPTFLMIVGVLTPSPVGSHPRVRRNRPHARETGRMRGNRIWVVRDCGRVSRASSGLASKAHGLEPSPSWQLRE
eukprot:5940978-Prymnesium_polylepis.3